MQFGLVFWRNGMNTCVIRKADGPEAFYGRGDVKVL